jgi:oligopeptide/dipeptide ABC transporter ATP-binding protein
MTPLLAVSGLSVEASDARGRVTLLRDLSFAVQAAECFGIVGESGSGKSMTVRSILGLLPKGVRVTRGRVEFDGQDLTAMPEAQLSRIRGRRIATVVQDAVSALNPVYRVGDQIGEMILAHGRAADRADARAKAIGLMEQVGIPAAARRVDDYPHQFSGGMCQRVVIAAALSCAPELILADEPTTALDVTIQDQILRLLVQLQTDLGLALVLVTHDMGVVAQTCQQVAVMYAGEIVELAGTDALFSRPRHPYTAGLLSCVPRLDGPARRLTPIPGAPPDLARPPDGCRFHLRCPLATADCRRLSPALRGVGPGHLSRCIHADRVTADLWGSVHA